MIKYFKHILLCIALFIKFNGLGQFHHFGLSLDVQGDIYVFGDFKSDSSIDIKSGSSIFLKGDLYHDVTSDLSSKIFTSWSYTEGFPPNGTFVFNNDINIQNLYISSNTVINSIDNSNSLGLNIINANSNFGNLEIWENFELSSSNVKLDSVNLELRYFYSDSSAPPRSRQYSRIIGESSTSFIESDSLEKIYLTTPNVFGGTGSGDGRHPDDYNLGLELNHFGSIGNTTVEYSRFNTYLPEVSDTSIDRYFVISEPDVKFSSPIISFHDGIIRSYDSDSLDIYVSENNGITYSQSGANRSGNTYVGNDNVWTPSNQSIITLAEKDCDELPTVVLSKDSSAICSGNSAIITFDTILPGCSIEWFKDGNFSSSLTSLCASTSYPSPEIDVINEGWYLITVKDSRGCINKDSIKIKSSDLPEFEASKPCFNINSPCDGDPLILSANPKPSDSSGMTYSWDFDFYNNNGSYTSSLKNPSWNYNQSGQYTVNLTITDSAGCSSSCERNAVVYPYPNVDFSFQNTCDGIPVNFNNNSSTSLGTLTYEWNFPSTIDNTQNPTHTFASPDTHNVELVVGVQNICYDTLVKSVVIYPNPTANFSFNDTCENDTVYFNTSSTVSSPSFITNYDWEFNDGSTSNADSTYFIYANSGTKNTSLRVQTNFGCLDSIDKSVTIFPSPTVGFQVQNKSTFGLTTEFCLVDTILLTANNSLMPSIWDLGNSNSSNNSSTFTTFDNYGTFNVSLSQTSTNGCSSTKDTVVIVHPIPEASTNKPPDQCFGLPVTFNSLSTVENNNTIINHDWNFNYPSISVPISGQNPPEKIFPDTGQHIIQLTVETNNNCLSSILDTVFIYPNPDIDFGQDSISTCGNSYLLRAPQNCTNFWSNGTTADSLIVNYSGDFFLQSTNLNECTSRETINIELNSIFNPSIESSSQCDSSILDCGSINSTVFWLNSNYDTLGNSRLLAVDSSGLYKVVAIDQNGCEGRDSSFININLSPVNFPSFNNYIRPCSGFSALTDSLPYDVNYSYSWTPPVPPLPSGNQPNRIYVDSLSTISVLILDTVSGCSLENVISVNPQTNPQLDLRLINHLTNDSVAVCDSVTLLSITSGPTSYIWTDISNSNPIGTNSSISINSTGYYKCEVFYTSCSNSDSIYVESYETPVFDLLNGSSDTLLCSYDTLFTNNLALYGSTFEWSSGDTTPTLDITSAGNYIVHVGDSLSQYSNIPEVNSGFCKSSDTILVSFRPILTVDLGPDLFKCNGSNLEVFADASQYPISSYTWNQNGNQISNSDSSLIIPDTGFYDVKIVDSYNCFTTDTIIISPTNNELYAAFLCKTIVQNAEKVKFVNLSYPEPFSSSWMINGSVYDSLSPTHTFLNPDSISDTVSAKLTVQNSNCTANLEKLIVIQPNKKNKLILNEDQTIYTEININLFPNPNNGNFILDFHVNNDYRIESYLGIFNLSGQSLYNEKLYVENNLQKQFNFEFLPRGVYIVTLYSGVSIKTIKFIKV